jgi:large subunit ribosomal protein L4
MSSQVIAPKDLGINREPEKDASVGVAIWTRVLLQNWRQGTVGCKGRADVAFSGKKPWKQKGTGRARAGMASSPLWRKGGVIFGPMPRVRKLKTTKKVKQLVLYTVLCDLLKQEKLISLKWGLIGDKPKTSYASNLLKEAGLLGKKVCLILQPGDIVQQASFSNITNLKMVLFDQINVVDLISANFVVIFDQDFDALKEVVSKWI